MVEDLASIAVTRLRFRLRFREDWQLPAFCGTTLRGAFGYALKRTVCHVAHGRCSECLLGASCTYSVIFEGCAPPGRNFMRKYARLPQPFVQELGDWQKHVVRAGKQFEFGLSLLGPAGRMYPYVVYAVLRAGQHGLGRERARFDVVQISDGTRVIFDGGDGGLSSPAVDSIVLPREAAFGGRFRLTLRYVTPLRLRINGVVGVKPTLSDLLRAAVRRLRILHHFYGSGRWPNADMRALLGVAQEAQQVDSQVQARCIERYSGRQKRTMPLKGVLGTESYELVGRSLVEWLQQASKVHLGKATSFGFGQVACQVEGL